MRCGTGSLVDGEKYEARTLIWYNLPDGLAEAASETMSTVVMLLYGDCNPNRSTNGASRNNSRISSEKSAEETERWT